MFGSQTQSLRRSHLISHIDSRRRVFSDAHYRQARNNIMLALETRDLCGHLAFDLIGDTRSV